MSARKRRKRSRQPDYRPVILVAAIAATLVLAGTLAWVLVKRDRGNGGRADRADRADHGGSGTPAPPDRADRGGSGTPTPSELAAAVAETDARDPNWRLADIAKGWAKLDPAKNAAPQALSAARQLPNDFGKALEGLDLRRDPSAPLPEPELERVRAVVRSCGPALTEARLLADYSAGQVDVPFDLGRPLDTPLAHLQPLRKTAALLMYDARVRAAAGDAPGAVRSAGSVLVLARCCQDEPISLSQVVNVAINAIAINALEGALTCAGVSDDELLALQWLLETGATETLAVALRGERALIHAAIETNTAGAVSPASHAWFLRTMNRAIDLAAKRVPHYSAEWTSFVADFQRDLPADLRVMPALDKFSASAARGTTYLRTAAVAVAAERYRRAAGAWPTDLPRQLVPKYIAALPTDPYTGDAIRSAQVAQGFSVYVKGEAAVASGEFSAIGARAEKCQGFRLLNPDRRRGGTRR